MEERVWGADEIYVLALNFVRKHKKLNLFNI